MTPHEQSPREHTRSARTPQDVDSLLAESLQTTPTEDFDWKEPERGPRWWERAEAEGQLTTPMPGTQNPVDTRAAEQVPTGMRTGQLVFGTICLLLAVWCLLGILFGIELDPLLVVLGICTLCGVILVAAGLRPRRRRL